MARFNAMLPCNECKHCYVSFHKAGGDVPIQHCSMTTKSAAWERSTLLQGATLFEKTCGPEGNLFERDVYRT